AQHGRGRATVLGRADDARRPHRRPRRAGGADRPLRPAQHGGGFSRHRPPSGRRHALARRRRRMSVSAQRAEASVPSAIAGRLRDRGPAATARRIAAMVLRYTFLFAKSWPRLIELIYWPTVQVILWGLISQFFLNHSSWLVQASGALLAAALLWDVLFRSELGV